MLLRVLREIFTRRPLATLPRDEAGFDRLMRDLVEANRNPEAFAAYDAALRAGIRPCDAAFDGVYRRSLTTTGSTPYPLRRRSRLHKLYRLMGEILPLQGDIAECGCFRGLSSHLILSRLRIADPGFTGAGYQIFDSFEGLSEPGPEDAVAGDDARAARLRAMTQRGWFAASFETVRESLAEFPSVQYYPGWIPQSFALAPERRYRLVHLDLDLYAPTLAALAYFHPRLVPGAIVVCDDYAWPGGRRAVDEFCAHGGIALETTPDGQAVLRRGS